jgi:leucine-zipper-like transcriptional regulator 1
MRNSWLFPVVCAALILVCTKSPEHITGSLSETDTALIYNPDTTPAVGAVVRFFVASDSTRTVAWESITDAKGHYSVSGLTKGTYNMLATKDTLIVYQDSIFVSPDMVLVKPDTLEKQGSITGIIGLQPNHNPSTVTVQVLGTDIYSNVDKDGRFTLAPVAKGYFNLRLVVTTLPDYTPTYKTIHTAGQKRDTLADTLWLIFTGIPVVTGLAAAYDTVNGLVHLSWNKTDYRDFQDYLIFRDPYNSIVLSKTQFATSSDTSFTDTVFKRNAGSGQYSFSDTNDYRFKYRVCIQNNSAKPGDTYKYVDIVAASPKEVETSFTFTFLHIAKQFVTDSASVNDSLLCSVKLSNPTRQLGSLVWKDVISNRTIRTATLDSTKNTASDSLVYAWNSVGEKGLECAVTDMAGTVWKDTAKIFIGKDAPVVTMTFSPDTITAGDSIHIHVIAYRKYGGIVKAEWDVGNTGQFSLGAMKNSVFDTAVVAPASLPDTGYTCVVRVTDDDGNVVLDTLRIIVNMFRLATGSAAFGGRWGHSSVVFNNKMWIISGSLNYPAPGFPSTPDTWYTEDGILWVCASKQVAFPARVAHTSLVFNNEMWVIGGATGIFSDGTSFNDVWFSSDGITWTQSTSAAGFSPRYGHSSVLFNNKMWVIGGCTAANNTNILYNDVWYSADGITWIQATATAGFSPRWFHSSVVFDNKIWVIGGFALGPTYFNDVWYSSDGVTWIPAATNAGFSPHANHSSVVFDNKMWVIAGVTTNWNELNDIWYSTNGTMWIQATANAGFSPRNGHSSVVYNNKMWVIAGTPGGFSQLDSDVWYYNLSGK